MANLAQTNRVTARVTRVGVSRVNGGCSANGLACCGASLAFEVIPTPGHTPACLTYKIDDAIFTGDALFVDDYGTGRCDFPRGSRDARATVRPGGRCER